MGEDGIVLVINDSIETHFLDWPDDEASFVDSIAAPVKHSGQYRG